MVSKRALVRPTAKHVPLQHSPSRPFYFGLVLVMHMLVALYMLMWVAILTVLPSPDRKSIRILWPTTTLVTYSIFLGLHGAAIGIAIIRRRRRHRVLQWVRKTTRSLLSINSLDQLTQSFDTYADEFFVVFNTVEILSQSHQAYTLFDALPEHSKAISYLVVVILYSFVSPLILFVRNTREKTTLLNLGDSIFSFTLSCGHPMVALLAPLAMYTFVDPTHLNHNYLFCTQLVLLARTQAVSNAFDYACKLAMHAGTLIALCRLTISLQSYGSPSLSTVDIPLLPTMLRQSKRWLLHLNLWLNVVWGCLLTAILVRSLVSGQPCPATCVANVRPLFDDTCQCAYVNINCKLVNVTDPIPFLNTSAIGTHLLYLEIRRCGLQHGLPPAALAPFRNLGKIIVLFSHMETWDGPLPPSVMGVMIRHSHLRAIPSALQVDLPPQFITLTLEGCMIPFIPDSIVQAWSTIERLYLLNISLQVLSPFLPTALGLVSLDVRSNNLTTLAPTWLVAAPSKKPLLDATFAGNALPDEMIPWHLAVTMDLSATSVSSPLPTALTKQTLVLDGTPFCLERRDAFCKPICAPGCFGFMRGDFTCNLECFNMACDYDGGDCDGYGFDRPRSPP
ncbi:Aste57867_9533 [Aphanomyces stellatus]|uniref:Aste57867_9533 protein n=1 Tax=Aphanomyces stellatus TaxID=120398 RepID=A0A485KN83_9STRA|nr:hypothetical protein As57867_009496 [Aphanomyces stellatus]VFT86412.1 Aste57867_9533 [Aphanomyces stellatus]